MTSKFEQLIEFVINDEEAKARELFHDIVVEKSREIYESLMEEEDAEDTQEVDEGMENDGDAADDLITDVETEEEGMNEEDDMDAEFDDGAEEAGDDLTKDIEGGEGEGDIEDRVVDLEDKLDELMAEFEAMMGGEGGEEEQEFDMDAGGDAIEMDDTSEIMPEMGMMEAVSLSKVAPAKMGDDGANTKSIVPHNSGAKGMAASPVKMTGDTAQGRTAPTAKDMIGKVGNSPSQSTQAPKPATKPHTAQATGVNTKSPLPGGRRG
jgi:hypothetical protein